MATHPRHQHWIFGLAALAVWLALGWPFLQELVTGTPRRDVPVPSPWLVPYACFGAAVFGAMILKPRTQWTLLCVQLAAVLAMAVIHPSDVMSIFLIVIAWQVAMATSPVNALSVVACQTMAMIGVLLLAPNPDLSYIIGLSLVLQLCFVFTAYVLRREAEAARALTQANNELRAAQAVIANTVRDAERLRISRELHDAWGHELTALGLQLEIAGHIDEPGRASDHVMRAKLLARDLLAKVRNVVATLRATERDHSEDAPGDDVRSSARREVAPLVAGHVSNPHHWLFFMAALAASLALAWPVLQVFTSGRVPPSVSVPWLVSFTLFAAAVFAAILLKLRPSYRCALLGVQLAAVAAMAYIASWAMMSAFLIIVAWQAAMTTGPAKALGWIVLQTLMVIGALAVAPDPDLCWVIGKSFALQLCFVFIAQAQRREMETARALAETNRELQSAQALITDRVRGAERLRISRELHDAWGHELIALGLQLEIANNVTDPARANDHVMQARTLARDLLGKVRDVVSTLREAERRDLKDAMSALSNSVPSPVIHVDIAPGLHVTPEQAHALIRCAQEAVTNAVKHANASNLWLQVVPNEDGVRLVARDDGLAMQADGSSSGSGLVGMRERVESLGGRLMVQSESASGFIIDAWLPSARPQAT